MMKHYMIAAILLMLQFARGADELITSNAMSKCTAFAALFANTCGS